LQAYISSIVNYNNGVLIGSDKGLLMMDTISSVLYTTLNSGLPGNIINDIVFDANINSYWLATDQGLVKTDFTNWTVYNTTNSGLPENSIATLYVDYNHNLWIGTKTNGLVLYNVNLFTVFNTNNSGLTDNRITDILTGPGNNIWIGTYEGGISVFDYELWNLINQTPNTSFADTNNSPLLIYPNPAKSLITIETGQLADFDNLQLTIINILGEEIPVSNIMEGQSKFNVNITSLAPGFYWCMVLENGTLIKKGKFCVAR
jgi:ligand-binding sensor domain-containing protein